MRKSKAARPAVLTYVVFAALAVSFVLAGAEIFGHAWHSGFWLGRLSLKWAVTLLAVYLFLLAVLAAVYAALFSKHGKKKLLDLFSALHPWRWWLIALVLVFSLWLVFFSSYAFLLRGFFTRASIYAIPLMLSTGLLTGKGAKSFDWKALLLAGLIHAAVIVCAKALILVNSFPFALHWSEGNRLWDYSIAFGSQRYNYSGSEPIFAQIDPGRQLIWGLVYLIPNVPIWAVRFWNAVLITVPYALLGWVAFRPLLEHRRQWLLAGFWALAFLTQGPIYTPLVLSAILVALVRRQPIWLALPVVFLAGHYVSITRYNWSFAVGIWVVMLCFCDAVLQNGGLTWRDWLRAFALGLAGIWTRGALIIQGVVMGLYNQLVQGIQVVDTSSSPLEGSQAVENLEGLRNVVTQQPFIWSRLLPNEVYPPGILLGLAVATLPLIALLVWLARQGYWKTVFWQRVALWLGLGAFLVVGVIASAKVGGGADLHNVDMFFVGLALVAGVAWESGLAGRLDALLNSSPTLRSMLFFLAVLPGLTAMVTGGPQRLPDAERTEFVLQRVQGQAACARQYGDVLLMDQRQLLTFGYLGDLPLVVDYEKKFVMDRAMAGDAAYFEQFEADLASGHFSMIISERHAILYKEPEMEDTLGDGKVEENNAWVHWVTEPLLRHYESISDYRDVGIEIFLPKERNFDCP
ncbi:MAG: hypothetical protein KIS85_01745 [Anaerolineales bacterium]|nr:hypothetical protein [Anaerolineales bacterium]